MAGKKENNSKNGSAASRGSRKNSSSGAKKALTPPVQPEKIQQALQAVKELQRPDRLHPAKNLKKIRQEAACEMRS